MKIIPTILLLFSTNIYAYETYEYIVYRNNFPQDRYRITESTINPTFRDFTKAGAIDIKEAAGQPNKITHYEKNYNEKYGLLNITPTKDSEKNLFLSMAKRNYIKILQIKKIVTIKNNIGGHNTELEIKILNPMPTDYFEIVKSTGVE